MRFNIENGILREYPQPMGEEHAIERINALRGNFKGVMVRNDTPTDIALKVAKPDNRNFIKLSIHYFVLGKKHYTEEQIAEFQAKGERDVQIISKNLRVEKGILKFFARFNPNKKLHSKVVYVDTNTNEAFTKEEMIEHHYLRNSSINQNRNGYDCMSIQLDRICEI